MTSSAASRMRSPRRRDWISNGCARAVARRAADDGLLDVAHGTYESPLGPLTVMVTPRGLLRLSYPGEGLAAQLDEVAGRISPRILAAPERTDAVRRQLDEYFAGSRHAFDVPIDWRLVRGFTVGVLRATARIPFGSVSTYRAVATEAGSPNALPCRGERPRLEPDPDRGAVPPGAPRRWGTRRLHRRPGSQAVPPATGGRSRGLGQQHGRERQRRRQRLDHQDPSRYGDRAIDAGHDHRDQEEDAKREGRRLGSHQAPAEAGQPGFRCRDPGSRPALRSRRPSPAWYRTCACRTACATGTSRARETTDGGPRSAR